jgi:hypothetical protein
MAPQIFPQTLVDAYCIVLNKDLLVPQPSHHGSGEDKVPVLLTVALQLVKDVSDLSGLPNNPTNITASILPDTVFYLPNIQKIPVLFTGTGAVIHNVPVGKRFFSKYKYVPRYRTGSNKNSMKLRLKFCRKQL